MESRRFHQQHVVITGAASGIGAAMARRFAAEGATVHLIDLNAEALGQLAAELGAEAHSWPCDVTDAGAMAAIIDGLPRIDVLINNAGIGLIGTVEQTTPEDFDRLMRVNAHGVFHGLRAAIPRMKAQGGGVVLNMGSVAAKIGIEARFAYSATKGAVLAMTLSVARDYAGDNIRCNCLCPARVHTPFVDGYLAKNFPGQEAEVFEKLSAWQPIGRMATPDEVAGFAAWLCSAEAAFVTGASYDFDGGAVSLR